MMDSIAKLYSVGKMSGAKDLNTELFAGFHQHCSKKATGYTNCCSVNLSGWGTNLGAGCKDEEKKLLENRRKNLCVYVGKENKGAFNVVVKHNYCCFGNMLNKTIQVQGRKQLGLSFGSGGSPNCRGLTLNEIMKLDFEAMDFSEFIEDYKVKFAKEYEKPDVNDMSNRIKSSMPTIKQYDGNENNRANNSSGWNTNVGVK